MHINWIGYQYREFDGYGRYGSRLLQALTRRGVQATPFLVEHVHMPAWMQALAGFDRSRLTISCLPPPYLAEMPGQWLLSMTEGSELPPTWLPTILENGVERIIVPCEHNAEAFATTGLPVHVIPGGTDPEEFPLFSRNGHRPGTYTFLALADRVGRKGWPEVWQAFFRAFGRPEDTPDVRLIVKARTDEDPFLNAVRFAENSDPRVSFWVESVDDVGDVYRAADCFAIPARSEGWGMPQREAAMMGLPVIVTRHSGLDDGHTDDWAIVVEGTRRARIAHSYDDDIAGEWELADVDELAEVMRWCFENPHMAAQKGRKAATWLRTNQTWDHAAEQLHALIEAHA